MLVGTAFDYLLRFELQRRASHAMSERWIADYAPDIIWMKIPQGYIGRDLLIGADPGNHLPPEVVAKRARSVLESAKKCVAEYIKKKVPDKSMQVKLAAHSIRLDAETALWLAGLQDRLHRRLVAVGLTVPRKTDQKQTLGTWLETYISGRTDAKPRTIINLRQAKTRLVEHFGEDKPLADITPGDADEWVVWLKSEYATSTSGRTVRRAKQLFKAAVRRKLIKENPFFDASSPSHPDKSREFFVTKEIAEEVLTACPSAEWRLIFALSRYGGLRCPSELSGLKWSDVNWEKNRLCIHSPKTEHLENHAERWIPLFPELRPHLEAAFDAAPDGATYLIGDKYRDSNANLRTQLRRILRRAGIPSWPKLFHNLRASRETELAAKYPIHVVCAWIGNSEKIAAKHYLQVTDEDFERGAKSGAFGVQNAVQQPSATFRNEMNESTEEKDSEGFMQEVAEDCDYLHSIPVPPTGLEPSQNTTEKSGSGSKSGAKSDALLTENPPLSLLNSKWPRLPERDRQTIMEILSR
jgi:integrase